MQTRFTDISVYQLSALALFGSPFNSHERPRQNFSFQYRYNIDQISDNNLKNINLGIINWSNTKFSALTLWELYGWQ